MRDIVIAGAGGFGREVAWTIERANAAASRPAWRIAGFADDAAPELPAAVAGYPVIGTVEEAAARFPDAAFAIAVGDGKVRAAIAERLKGRDFPAIVDPAAAIAPSAKIGKGAFVAPLALVSVDAELGDFAVVNARAGIGHDVRVGAFATVSPGVSLSGFTRIGDYAFMGTNSSTVQGVSIGRAAKVAAGTPAYRDVAEGATLSPFGTLLPNGAKSGKIAV